MLQRIQTVYLLGAFILLIVCFFAPMAQLFAVNGAIYFYNLKGLNNGNPEINLLMIFSIVVAVFIFATIFQYKNRKRQIKVCFFLIFLLVIINGIAFYQLLQYGKQLNLVLSYHIPLVFPLISAVLVYIATRGIKKDEELVRSYERLR